MNREEQIFFVDPQEWTTDFDSVGGERSLLAAVLIHALWDLGKRGEKSRSARRFFQSEDEEHVCSFRSICAYLSLEPDRILEFVSQAGMKKSRLPYLSVSD